MFIEELVIIAPKWKQVKCPSTVEWIKIVVNSYSEISYSNKNKQTATQKKMDGSHGHPAEQKQPETKRYIMYNSIYMKFKNWRKLVYDVGSQVSGYL